MIAWMLYTSLAGVLIAVAATAVDRMARLTQRATRWVWLAAIAATVALVVAAPYPTAVTVPIVTTSAVETRAPGVADAPSLTRLEVAFRTGQRVFSDPVAAGIATINSRLPHSAPAFAFGAWLVSTALLAVLFLLVQTRFARARRRWPVADVHGARVRVAPSTGPVVIGVVRPEIVVPRWMFERAADDQRAVIAHEAEHVRARDTVLLAAGWTAVVLMPWNLALWFMLSRIRLAIELDCDARVLRGGVAPRAYGELLIDLAERAVPLRLATTALSDDSSHLHQRILAMKPQVPRFAFARASVAATLGIVSLLAACATALPTDADIQKMDGASAEKAARQLALITKDSVVYVVDGMKTTEAAAKALPADRIASINVVKSTDGASNAQIAITTKQPDGQPSTVSVSGRGRVGGPGDVKLLATKEGGPTPIFFIDGVRTDQAAFKKLNRDDIDAVEVIKGPAAAREYGPEAMNGAIVVHTKSGARKGK